MQSQLPFGLLTDLDIIYFDSFDDLGHQVSQLPFGLLTDLDAEDVKITREFLGRRLNCLSAY